MRLRHIGLIALLVFGLTAVAIAQDDAPEETPEATPETTPEPIMNPDLMTVEIVSERPHDPAAFTQGFLWYEGRLYESTGRYDESTLRVVDPETGDVEQSIDIDEDYFAEGLARVDDRLIQLTWQENTAFVYDLETFEQLDTFTYEGEGWGLCYDGEYLYMSDGSPVIFVRDPETFDVVDTLLVAFRGEAVPNVNELECVDDHIYANVWQTDFIIRIDKTSGQVDGIVDAQDLLTPEQAAEANVLNGIAYDEENDLFLITGKLWPTVFAVHFVEFAPE